MSSQVPNIINVNQVLFTCEKFLQDSQEPRCHEKFFFRTYIDIKCLLFYFPDYLHLSCCEKKFSLIL